MDRALEIAQGLRTPDGGLVGGLDALEYLAGWSDYETGRPPPDFSSRDYDLGRARAAERASERADVLATIRKRQGADHQRMREFLKDYPEILADYDARIAALPTPPEETKP